MEMGEKPYAELDKMLILTDLFDNDREPDVLAGVAIRAEDLQDFVAAVEQLAIERFGGETFQNLLENDVEDRAADQAIARRRQVDFDRMYELAKEALRIAEEEEERRKRNRDEGDF